MEGLFTGLSGAMNLERRLQIATHDLANLNTPGHKRTRLAEQSEFPRVDEGLIHRSDPRGLDTARPEIAGAGVQIFNQEPSALIDFSQGQLRVTGHPLNLALEGEGFFVVEVEGAEMYTRNGAFELDANGVLSMRVGAERWPVLGEGGPLTLDDSDVRITQDGTVTSQEGTELGRIRVATFSEPQRLERIGFSLWNDPGGSAQIAGANPTDVTVHQHSLEMSNTNPVLGLVEMIEIQRANQAIAKVMSSIEEAVGRRISEAATP